MMKGVYSRLLKEEGYLLIQCYPEALCNPRLYKRLYQFAELLLANIFQELPDIPVF